MESINWPWRAIISLPQRDPETTAFFGQHCMLPLSLSGTEQGPPGKWASPLHVPQHPRHSEHKRAEPTQGSWGTVRVLHSPRGKEGLEREDSHCLWGLWIPPDTGRNEKPLLKANPCLDRFI